MVRVGRPGIDPAWIRELARAGGSETRYVVDGPVPARSPTGVSPPQVPQSTERHGPSVFRSSANDEATQELARLRVGGVDGHALHSSRKEDLVDVAHQAVEVRVGHLRAVPEVGVTVGVPRVDTPARQRPPAVRHTRNLRWRVWIGARRGCRQGQERGAALPHRGGPMATLDSAQLLAALEPTVEDNLNRHLAAAQEWMPHEYVPWSRAATSPTLGGEPWSAEQSHALADRAHRPRGQPAHRGQPAELPPRDRAGVRPRQRLGHVGEPLDGRGGSARLLHPRLPARHARRRPRRARAGPDGDDGDRLRLRATSRCSTSAPTSPSRSSPPASRTATPAATPRSRSPRSC